MLDAATTFSVFGLYYFVFGLFAFLGFVMLGIILMAEPDQQYDLTDLVGEDELTDKDEEQQ